MKNSVISAPDQILFRWYQEWGRWHMWCVWWRGEEPTGF